MDKEVFTKENPSPQYLKGVEWAKNFHAQRKTFTGRRTFHPFPTIQTLFKEHDVHSLLDYGCGKGEQYQIRDVQVKKHILVRSLVGDLSIESLGLYDPAWPQYAKMPAGNFDAVICVDVLEYVPPQDLLWVLREMFSKANKLVFINYNSLGTTKVEGDDRPPVPTDPPWFLDQVVSASRPGVDWCVRIDCDPQRLRYVYRRHDPYWRLAARGQLYAPGYQENRTDVSPELSGCPASSVPGGQPQD